MSILTNITRGGQLSLHAIRMFRQVCMTLISWCLILWIILFSIKIYDKFTQNQFQAYIDYNLASILNAVGLPNKNISVYYYRTKSSYMASTVIRSSYFINRTNVVNTTLKNIAQRTTDTIAWLFLVLSSYFIYRGVKKSGEQFQRGAEFKLFKQVKQKINRSNLWRSDYSLANMPYPKNAEQTHTLIVGSTGVGKTVLISDLVEQIRRKGDRAIIFDKKCDFAGWFYDSTKDFILNPFDSRGVKWNLLGEIENNSQIKTIAESFIPSKGHYAGESRVWDEAARIAFTSILEKLIKNNDCLTNRDIADAILKQNINKIAALVKGTYAESIIDPNSPKTASSVLFVLSTYFNSLRIDNARKEESFSIRKWVRESKDSIIFITTANDNESDLKPLQTAWFEITINSILSNETKQKTWLILDELPTLQKIPSLAKGLAVARSYGGCFVLGIQNIAQMKEVYGLNNTQSISAECNNRCIFRTNDPDTAKWMVENIGYRETKEYIEGLSYGASELRDGITLSENEKLKAIVLPSEIQNMPNLALFLKMANYPVTKAHVKYKTRLLQSDKFTKNENVECLDSDEVESEEAENESIINTDININFKQRNNYTL